MSLPPPQPRSTAIVTGASSGIGAHIAREIAERGHNLTLVARREDKLEELGEEITAGHGVRVDTLSCDLGDDDARARLPERIAELGTEVEILVNNAGFATGGPFVKSDLDREIQQVRVLCEAVVSLCGMFVPAMVERGRGAVLNVASTAGMQPLPYSAGYSAAKAWALTFSEALHTEVASKGVTVTALCPGPVETEFWEAAGGDQPIEGALPRVAWVPAPAVAKAGVDGLASGHRVVVPGIAVQATTTLSRFIPHAVKLPILERMMRRGAAAED